MKLGFLVVWGILAAFPVTAEEPWTLQTGPEAVDSIPVDPVQPVSAWRGLYADGSDRVWVYVTRSAFFFVQSVSDARAVSGTPWTIVAFFPSSWKPPVKTAWLDLWAADFRNLESLANPGWPIVMPAVLRKGP